MKYPLTICKPIEEDELFAHSIFLFIKYFIRMKYLFVPLFLITSIVYSQNTLKEVLDKYNTNSIPYISVESLQKQLGNDIVLLDAREPEEFNISHIPSANSVGYKQFSISNISDKIKNKDTPIVVYCSIGVRSEKIGEQLKKAGYTNVANLYGGIFEWKNKQCSLINSQNQKTDSVHTYSKEWSKWLNKGIKVYK